MSVVMSWPPHRCGTVPNFEKCIAVWTNQDRDVWLALPIASNSNQKFIVKTGNWTNLKMGGPHLRGVLAFMSNTTKHTSCLLLLFKLSSFKWISSIGAHHSFQRTCLNRTTLTPADSPAYSPMLISSSKMSLKPSPEFNRSKRPSMNWRLNHKMY